MKAVTIGIVAGAAALLVLGYKAAKKAANDFSFEVTGYGRPTLQSTELSVPLKLRAHNPTSLPINIDLLDGDVYLNKAGSWVLAAQIQQPVSLQPGTQEIWVHPRLNLQNVFGGNLIQTLQAIAQLQQTKKLQIRADVGGKYGVLTIPKQSFTETIDL